MSMITERMFAGNPSSVPSEVASRFSSHGRRTLYMQPVSFGETIVLYIQLIRERVQLSPLLQTDSIRTPVRMQ